MFDLTIGGQRVATRDRFAVVNPSTGAVVGEAPNASPADLDRAVAAARAALPDDERAAACAAIVGILTENAEELARLLTQEQGKPLNGLGSRWEMGGAAAWAGYTASLSLPEEILQDDASGRVRLIRRPIGVVGSITPWNFPVMIAIWHILPALRAGNAVVIKPSPLTPLATLRLVELVTHEAFQKDRRNRMKGAAPAMVPVVAEDPLAPSALPTPDSWTWFTETQKLRAPSWRNEVTLRPVEKLTEYEPASYISYISPTPLLMVVALGDHLTVADQALAAYERALHPKKLVTLNGGHFDAYVADFEHAEPPATDWFRKHLAEA